MKSIFIAYDQAHHDHIIEILNRHSCRGFTGLGIVQGRGSHRGEPHYGTHVWPSLAQAIITVVPDDSAPGVMADLKALDESRPRLGLRAFLWTVEESI